MKLREFLAIPGVLAVVAALLLAGWGVAARADQATPSPSPTPAAPASPAPALPFNPATFDPCGGQWELPNKLGNGTACVFVLGEVAADASYTTITAPVSSTITGPFMRSVTASGSISADSYPGSTIYAGVGPRSQISFAPPTYVSVNTRAGVTTGGTDMTFAYKHLFLLNLEKFTMLAISAAYTAPTAGAPFGGVGPKYQFDPIFTQPLPQNLGITLAGPINNFSTSSIVCPMGIKSCHNVIGARGWSWTPQFAPYWLSPGGTMVAGFVQHGFNPNTWPAAAFISQSLNRHVEVYVQYGGGSVSVNSTGPVLGLFKTATYVTPTVFAAGIAVLAGESNLPPALLQMMAPPPASPQPQATPQVKD